MAHFLLLPLQFRQCHFGKSFAGLRSCMRLLANSQLCAMHFYGSSRGLFCNLFVCVFLWPIIFHAPYRSSFIHMLCTLQPWLKANAQWRDTECADHHKLHSVALLMKMMCGIQSEFPCHGKFASSDKKNDFDDFSTVTNE